MTKSKNFDRSDTRHVWGKEKQNMKLLFVNLLKDVLKVKVYDERFLLFNDILAST